MAGVMGLAARAQYRAMAQMRWRMLVNSLRTRRGKVELGAGILSYAFSLLIYLGVGLGMGFGAWHLTSSHHVHLLWLLLWAVLLMWQGVPIIMTTYQQNIDLTILLRFPVSFASYALLYVLYGLFSGSSLLGGVALLGIWIGTTAAQPQLALWTAVVLIAFAAFNILLTRMIFAWLDRWLAQRKTREIFGTLLLFLFLGLQALNPAYHQRNRHHAGGYSHVVHKDGIVARYQGVLPPGLAARSIYKAVQGHIWQALAPLGWLGLYALGAGALLGVRMHAEYRGESLGEGPGRVKRRQVHAGMKMPAAVAAGQARISSPLGAIFEKELRYLSRSGVMFYSLLAPLVLLFLFGGMSGMNHEAVSRYAFPVGVAYGFLGTVRLMGNSLGGESAGIQLYFLSPTPFKTVMLAKNLLQTATVVVELVLVSVIVRFRFGMPDSQIVAATLCWALFALSVQLAIGNVISITMAYRMALTRISRGKGGTGNALLTLLVELLLFGIGAAVLLPLVYTGHAGVAVPIFLVLAAGGIIAWMRGLGTVDRMATARRETLIATLLRET